MSFKGLMCYPNGSNNSTQTKHNLRRMQARQAQRNNPIHRPSILSRILGALVSLISKPIINIAVIAFQLLIAPFRIPYFIYENCTALGYSPAARFLLTYFVSPVFLVITVGVSALTLLGTALFSPFAGIYEGLRSGIRSTFKMDKLGSLFLEFIDHFPKEERPPARARQEGNHDIERQQLLAEQEEIEYQPQARAQQHQAAEQHLPIIDPEAEDIDRFIRALGNADNANLFIADVVRIRREQEEKDLQEGLRLSMEGDQAPQNLDQANPAARLITQYGLQLASNIEALQASPQGQLPFLTQQELVDLEALGPQNPKIQRELELYKALIEKHICPFTASKLDEIADPMIIEHTAITEAGQSRTQLYTYERQNLIDYLNFQAQQSKIPDIVGAYASTPLDIGSLIPSDNGRDIESHQENSKTRIYRGIDQLTHDLVAISVMELRSLLNADVQQQIAQAEQEQPEHKEENIQPVSQPSQRQLILQAYSRRAGNQAMFNPAPALNNNPHQQNSRASEAAPSFGR
jgi:hypothetical protein